MAPSRSWVMSRTGLLMCQQHFLPPVSPRIAFHFWRAESGLSQATARRSRNRNGARRCGQITSRSALLTRCGWVFDHSRAPEDFIAACEQYRRLQGSGCAKPKRETGTTPCAPTKSERGLPSWRNRLQINQVAYRRWLLGATVGGDRLVSFADTVSQF